MLSACGAPISDKTKIAYSSRYGKILDYVFGLYSLLMGESINE
jgi:hypothetical protein